jgi:hypothetical protein
MVMMKKFCIFGVLVLVAVLVRDAMALPSGAYVDDNNKTWRGFKSYTNDGFDVILDWAVYKISSTPAAFQGIDFPDGDNFIYAYQLFNDPDATKDVGFLSMLDITGKSIEQTVMHGTQSVADGTGKMTDPNPSSSQGEWAWTAGVGFVSANTKSAFLIFSSVYGPTRGSFVVKGPEEEPPPIPEPASIALFGTAAGLFLARRTRKHQLQ